jgi:hypothetical protein
MQTCSSILTKVLDELNELGFGSENPIDAADTVEAVGRHFNAVHSSVQALRKSALLGDIEMLRAFTSLEILLSACSLAGMDGGDGEVDGADLIDELNEVLPEVYAVSGRKQCEKVFKELDADVTDDISTALPHDSGDYDRGYRDCSESMLLALRETRLSSMEIRDVILTVLDAHANNAPDIESTAVAHKG